jgi:redox-sensitive bicupin YhaK (pirin superfamily)
MGHRPSLIRLTNLERMASVQIRRSADRAVTRTDWLTSRHSFSFGPHYDAGNLAFGPLLAFNCDLVQPGPGYVGHRHAGLDILTWVVSGTLLHEAATGTHEVRPGQLQYLATGSGLEHSERSASDSEPVQVLQLWLTAGQPGRTPHYVVGSVEPVGQELMLLASGRRQAPVRLDRTDTALLLGRPRTGSTLELYVISGEAVLAGDLLSAGDAVRAVDAGPLRLDVTADAELLVLAFSADSGLESQA